MLPVLLPLLLLAVLLPLITGTHRRPALTTLLVVAAALTIQRPSLVIDAAQRDGWP